MKRNNKIKMLQEKLEKTLKVEKDKFIEAFKESLDRFPIYTFCSTKDLDKLLKDIYDNRDENPIIIELLYEENKKNIKEKTEEKEEVIEENNEIEETNNFE
ncbi:hypothetical protein [Streptobacillus moniliformis]|uniref:hypothetical protein n=1 Tax=Streptobacillus moniliformis TaxID=34105 RepID=UPI0007E3BFCA|nr:hypothetical protein [Streptobacillus moniliformis]